MGSLFDGIGGFPLAAVRNGIRPVWASEIEAFPIEVTRLRFPDMIHVGDIMKLNGADLPPVDIITGGSPCQDLSVAGARAGLAGKRSGLFMEQTRIVKEMRNADKLRGRTDQFLYFLSLRLYSTVRLAKLRGQSDRNIRKVRDTYTRKLQSQLYDHLCKLQEQEKTLTLREREFLELYQVSLDEKGKKQARVRPENKYPKRKKATPGNSKDGS